jgi:hypothetical protein
MRSHLAITIAALGLSAAVARAGTVAVKIELKDDGHGNQVASHAAPVPSANVGDVIEITCPTSCSDLVVSQGTKELKKEGTSTNPADKWTSPPLAADGDSVAVRFRNDSFAIPVAGGAAGATGGTGGGGGISGIIRPECPKALAKNEMAVDTTGNVLGSNVSTFTEDDSLVIWVFGPPSSVDAIRVERRSAFRDVTALRIQGDASAAVGGVKQSGGPVELVCKRTQLADFTAGRGQFALVGTDGKTVAEFEFAVRPIFDGMFTVAYVSTWLVDHSFSADGDGKLVQDPAGTNEGRFALMYTGFLTLSKFSRHVPPLLDNHLGASVGVLLDHPTRNLLFGLNLGPFNGLSFVFGGHFGRVTVLKSGHELGESIAADAPLPTTNDWKTDWFIGASVDITVATRLFFGGFGR